MNIERTLFWFKDGDEQLVSVEDDFFGIATLLNRLLNHRYDGKKIKFINLYFYTKKTFELYPVIPKETPYYYDGHLTYYGFVDMAQFNLWNWNEKKNFVWEKACGYIKKSAEVIKNPKLLDAVEHAYLRGVEMNLNPDYRQLDLSFSVSNQKLQAFLWILFKEDGMHSVLVVEKDANVIFERQIDEARKGVEFFLEMYKALEFDGESIVIKGRKDVDHLPLKIPLSEFSSKLR